MDRARVRALSKIGAFIRRSARSSIRKVGKKGTPSNPGQPPKSRTGLLRDFIQFAYDPATKSVVVGPEKLNRPSFAPPTLEYGGSYTVTETQVPEWTDYAQAKPNPSEVWVRVNPRRAKGNVRKRTVTQAPRPYMMPALQRERDNGKLIEQWKNVLTS